MSDFVALDFETANTNRSSACALALVRVRSGRVVEKRFRLIRPPSSHFQFSYLHGITWKHVELEASFPDVWQELGAMCDGGLPILAHNASFDRSVLSACCQLYDVPLLKNPFICTVKLARSVWDIRPTKLNNVCDYLGIQLDHHQAESDALACAHIGLRAIAEGKNIFDAQISNSSRRKSAESKRHRATSASSSIIGSSPSKTYSWPRFERGGEPREFGRPLTSTEPPPSTLGQGSYRKAAKNVDKDKVIGALAKLALKLFARRWWQN